MLGLDLSPEAAAIAAQQSAQNAAVNATPQNATPRNASPRSASARNASPRNASPRNATPRAPRPRAWLVATARKLSVLLLSLWRSGAVYEPLRASGQPAIPVGT